MREIISNILAHRDYSNAYTAQFVIKGDRIFTKNSNLPHGHGELRLTEFEPFPKNPPISKVFREIGYADELGSGMRNTNKYTKLYLGGTPMFIEDNIFKIVIPMENAAVLQVGPESMNKETNKETNKEISEKILDIMRKTPEISVKETAQILDISVGGVRYHINKMKKLVLIGHIGSTLLQTTVLFTREINYRNQIKSLWIRNRFQLLIRKELNIIDTSLKLTSQICCNDSAGLCIYCTDRKTVMQECKNLIAEGNVK